MTQEELDNKIARAQCCTAQFGYRLLKAEQNRSKDADCLYTKTKYLNTAIEALTRFEVPGTVLGYELAVCATIDVTPMIADLRDNMNVTLVIGPPANITLVDITGNYAGLTATQFIDILVDAVNTSPGGLYTATNDDPDPTMTVCFNGTLAYNLIGATISIVQPGYWYLKYTSKIARDIPATPEVFRLLGYSAIFPIRPVYVPANNKLYIPNGDLINTIYPQNATPSLRAIFNYNFSGVAPGDVIFLNLGDVFDTGLSTMFFNDGDPADPYGPRKFSFTYIVNDTTLVNCPNLLDPALPVQDVFTINCTITPPGYVTGTGEITFTVDSVQRNSTTSGLGVGLSMPATSALSCGTSGYPKGRTGVAIGARDWTFAVRGTGWGTLAIYDCDLDSGLLTYNQTIEIPVGRASDACYFPNTELVGISGFGNTSLQDKVPLLYPMCSINTSTDAIDVFNNTNTRLDSIKYNPVITTAYLAGGATKILKVDENFTYDGSYATDQVVNAQGGITYDDTGTPYIASGPTAPSCVIKKMSGVPNAGYNAADPAFFTLFTCPDFSPASPNLITATSFDGFTAGTTNQTLNVGIGTGAGLDGLGPGGTNLIWTNPAQFSLSYDTALYRYTVTCVINTSGPGGIGYSNTSGVVYFDVLTVTKTTLPIPPGTTTTNVTLSGPDALGAVNWTWRSFPFIKGSQDLFLHNPTGRLFVSRVTSVGALLQSYDITPAINTAYDAGIEATILASKVNHFSPGYPTVTLTGPINYLREADMMLVVYDNGQKAYTFDPYTLTWGSIITHLSPPRGGDLTTTGGMISFSYTGDDTVNSLNTSKYNFFSSTPNGSELGVVSFMLDTTSQVFGVFDGEADEIVTDGSDNCLEEDEVENIIEVISSMCCDCCASDSQLIQDI